jgi:hypothetical protein
MQTEIIRNQQFQTALAHTTQELVMDALCARGACALEHVLTLSAMAWAGPPQRGKGGDDLYWYGTQRGTLLWFTHKLSVNKPRIRRRGVTKHGEVVIPAYQMMKHTPGVLPKLEAILLANMHPPRYARIIPAMALACGLLRRQMDRTVLQSGEDALRQICEQRCDNLDLSLLLVDGIRIGEHAFIVAIGQDTAGQAHFLGLRPGTTSNRTQITGILTDIIRRGVRPDHPYVLLLNRANTLRLAALTAFPCSLPISLPDQLAR